VEALVGVDLEVEQGGFVTVFGPNGAGKTTLIKIAALLVKPTSGTVYVAGLDARRAPLAVRARIGVVSHEPYLYPGLSVIENVEFFASLYSVQRARERAYEVLELVGARPWARRLVRSLSRGMQQRVALARALVHDPPLVLLDEPYTGLDQHGSALFTELLAGLKCRGHTVLMTTHDVERGLGLCERALIMDRGRIVCEIDPASVGADEFRRIYMRAAGGGVSWSGASV